MAKVVKQLAAAGQEVLAWPQLDRLPKGEVDYPVAFDFTWLPDQMAVLTGVDAIVFTAGSREKSLQVDLNGAVVMQAANLVGDQTLSYSSAYSWTKRCGEGKTADIVQRRYFADKWLVDESGLDYLVQAGLTEEPGRED